MQNKATGNSPAIALLETGKPLTPSDLLDLINLEEVEPMNWEKGSDVW